MRVQIICLVLVLSFPNAYSQYNVGSDDGFSYNSAEYNPLTFWSIYSVGNDDGFSNNFSEYNPVTFWSIYSVGDGDGFFEACTGSTGNEVALPIELLSLDANCSYNLTKIQWTTASEFNNEYFTIEKSTDAIHFKSIGIIKGAGNSLSLTNYTFDVNEINIGIVYYRLKQTDFDGFITYSKVISVDCITDLKRQINIFPNPVINVLIVEANDNQGIINFEIFNTLGNSIYKDNFIGTTKIEMNYLPPGVYLLKFTNGEAIEYRKLVKNN